MPAGVGRLPTMPLDLIAIGRVSVDLYGQQIGTALEDVATFAKAVGGCPANVAIGAARLGLKSALISRVGDEPMGRFVREQLAREGVDTRALRVDPLRLTALVLLGVRDQHSFPLIFYRENCADAALCEEDIDEQFIAGARALLVTGTHFSLPAAARAQHLAVRYARAHGVRVILDIDYRPNLWGLGGHGAGESRYARSARATQALAAVLPECDLIVGTEEELHIAAGVEDTLAALRQIRARSPATLVCKRGAAGCIVFAGAIPERLEDALVVPGLAVEIYNVLGAGDAFLAGFLSGYLRGRPDEESARLGNACGAIAVSRLLCSVEFPTLPELQYLLEHGSRERALRRDDRLNHLHWVTTRRSAPHTLIVVRLGGPVAPGEPAAHSRTSAQFAELVAGALTPLSAGHHGFGVQIEAAAAEGLALASATGGLWRARRIESTPQVARHAFAAELLQWPSALTVAFRCQAALPLEESQLDPLREIAVACRAHGRELLVELTSAAEPTPLVERIYELGVRPDWWQLPPQSTDSWRRCAAAIAVHDPYCRGMLVECDAQSPELTAQLVAAARCPLVRGLSVGRSIVAPVASAWMDGRWSDAVAAAEVARRCAALAESWLAAGAPPSDRSAT